MNDKQLYDKTTSEMINLYKSQKKEYELTEDMKHLVAATSTLTAFLKLVADRQGVNK